MAAAWLRPPADEQDTKYHGLNGQQPLPTFGNVTPIFNSLPQQNWQSKPSQCHMVHPPPGHHVAPPAQSLAQPVQSLQQPVQSLQQPVQSLQQPVQSLKHQQPTQVAHQAIERSQTSAWKQPSSVFGRASQLFNRLLGRERLPSPVKHNALAAGHLPSFGTVTPLGKTENFNTWPPSVAPRLPKSVEAPSGHYRPLDELLAFLNPVSEPSVKKRTPSPSPPPPAPATSRGSQRLAAADFVIDLTVDDTPASSTLPPAPNALRRLQHLAAAAVAVGLTVDNTPAPNHLPPAPSASGRSQRLAAAAVTVDLTLDDSPAPSRLLHVPSASRRSQRLTGAALAEFDARVRSPLLPVPLTAPSLQPPPPLIAPQIHGPPTPLLIEGVLHIFSDGSYRNRVGGCGVAYKSLQGKWYGIAVCLGHIRGSAEAEKYGVSNAFSLATELIGEVKMLVIHTDSTSVINNMKQAVRTGITPCQIIASILEQDGQLRARGVTTMVAWVKGHAQSIGNNVADKMAAKGSLAASEGVPAGTRFQKLTESGLRSNSQSMAIAFQEVTAGTCYDDPDKLRAAAMARSDATRRKMEVKRRVREKHLKELQRRDFQRRDHQKRMPMDIQVTGRQNEQRGIGRSQRFAAPEPELAGSRLHPISLD